MFRQRRLAAVDLGLSPELRHSRPFSVIPAPFPSFPRKRESILIIDKKQARLSHPRSSPGATKKKTKEHKRIFTTGNTGAATRRFRGPPWIISVSINTHTTLANGISEVRTPYLASDQRKIGDRETLRQLWLALLAYLIAFFIISLVIFKWDKSTSEKQAVSRSALYMGESP